MTPRRIAAALAAGLVLGGGLAAPVGPAAAQAVSQSVAGAAACGTPAHAFTPASITIPRVVGPTRVLALGRDRNGVPKTPPLTDRGKWEFAWDRESHIRAGSPHGVVRLNAHTYPRDGSYGLALGNRLLARLRVGATLVVTGRGELRMCYRVTRRIRVRAEQSVPAYYASNGRPLLAILVCSGVRRGPGDWSHRTIWFAQPVAQPVALARRGGELTVALAPPRTSGPTSLPA